MAKDNEASILKDHYNTEGLALYCNISARTLARAADMGTGPKRFKLGRRWYYRKDDVVAWLATMQAA